MKQKIMRNKLASLFYILASLGSLQCQVFIGYGNLNGGISVNASGTKTLKQFDRPTFSCGKQETSHSQNEDPQQQISSKGIEISLSARLSKIRINRQLRLKEATMKLKNEK